MTRHIPWQKSSFSGGGGEDCMEVAARGEDVLIRESDLPKAVIITGRGNLAALLTWVKFGESDQPTP
ncbi:DUF397 domain-containing protein [Streptomyces sp. I05A-00742]|uniref:DUF397 domain-containing protein n=1 Tax=Streptomyces sp. I05A-00742 TaxID=2732853 RepID=UPI001487B930|nr:DUF397 domain-containing protein [Streptomyces sp. I05A-00742]